MVNNFVFSFRKAPWSKIKDELKMEHTTYFPPHRLNLILKELELSNMKYENSLKVLQATKRHPIHTFYGGAHLFKANSLAKLTKMALQTLHSYKNQKENKK